VTRRVVRRFSEWRLGRIDCWHLVLDCGHDVAVYPRPGEKLPDEIECPMCGEER
jgi:hypothetical protein